MYPELSASRRTLFDALVETVRDNPDGPALLGDTVQLSWTELLAEVEQVAGLLWQRGVRPGDVVGALITKRPEVVTTFLACARIGALYAPVNFKLHVERIQQQFDRAEIKTVVVEAQFDGILKALLRRLPDPGRIVYVGPTGKHGSASFDDRIGCAAPPVQVHPDDPCYLNYTSGTTGRPKGALTSHASILYQGLTAFDGDTGLTPQGFEGLGFRRDEVFLGMFSVFAHPHELFHRSLLCGGPFVILDSLNPRVIAQAIERFRVTWMMAVPSFYEMLLDHEGSSDLSSLRVLESGGAFVGAETLARMEERFGASFMPVWGSTETTGVALAMRPDRPRRPGTTGKPISGYAVKVADAQGREVEPDQVGELLVRGPSVVRSYVNDPDETTAAFRDGWYHTQDLVRRTPDGFIAFVGRRSEMLKIGGIRVYPLEIERVLGAHPQVREVVVVRAEERIRGEIARAVVECLPGATCTVRELQRYCRERLAPYKVPRVVEFWKVPRLPNGKVDKQAILARPMDPSRDER